MNFDVVRWLNSLQSIGWKYFAFAGVAFLIFYVLFSSYFSRIKIQQGFPKHRDYYRDVFFSFISMMIFATTSYIVFFVLKLYNNIFYGSVSEYGNVYFYFSFIWMFFLH